MTVLCSRIALGFALGMLAGPVRADETPRPVRDHFGDPLPAGAVARLRTCGRVTAAALSRDGGTAFTAGDEGTIYRWDALTGRERGRYLGHKAEVVGLLLSPDGRTLFSQSKDNTLRAWDVDSGAQRWRRDGLNASGCRPALSPDGKKLAAVSRPNVVELVEAATGERLHELTAKSGGNIWAVAFTADASAVLAPMYYGPVCRWETAAGLRLPELVLPPGPKLYL